MSKWIISRYNHDISYLKDYTDDYILYDRSEVPIEGSIVVPNTGSDLYDKFTYIIDNYDNLPDVAVYTKANIFKYCTPEEFELIKDNKTYTPIFTKHHKETTIDLGKTHKEVLEMRYPTEEMTQLIHRMNLMHLPPEVRKFSFYDADGMYNELNIPAYLQSRPTKDFFQECKIFEELQGLLGILGREYLQFAPGSNYILPKENILKHPKAFYEKLRSYLDWDVYPGEAMVVERGLHTIWR